MTNENITIKTDDIEQPAMMSAFGDGGMDVSPEEINPDAIIEAAEIVRDNEEPNSNTHVLVGGVLVAMAKEQKRARNSEEETDESLDGLSEDVEQLKRNAVTSVGLMRFNNEISGIDYEKNGARYPLSIPNATEHNNGFMSQEQVEELANLRVANEQLETRLTDSLSSQEAEINDSSLSSLTK